MARFVEVRDYPSPDDLMDQDPFVRTTPTVLDAVSIAACPRRGAILVVEDREDVREGLAQLLEFQGHMVLEAANANEAFAQLESSPNGIALILLDLNLPGASGADLRAAQLATPQLSAIPLIVVSACAPDSAGSEALRPAAWFEKPFRVGQLLEEVKKHVLT